MVLTETCYACNRDRGGIEMDCCRRNRCGYIKCFKSDRPPSWAALKRHTTAPSLLVHPFVPVASVSPGLALRLALSSLLSPLSLPLPSPSFPSQHRFLTFTSSLSNPRHFIPPSLHSSHIPSNTSNPPYRCKTHALRRSIIHPPLTARPAHHPSTSVAYS